MEKAKTISKVIAAKKEEKKSSAKSPKIVLAKSSSVKMDKIKPIKSRQKYDIFKDLSKLAGVLDKKPIASKTVKVEQEKTPVKKEVDVFRIEQTSNDDHAFWGGIYCAVVPVSQGGKNYL